MGKRYKSELEELSATYSFCREHETRQLESFIAGIRTLPLFCIGSGGSLAVAQYGAALHEHFSETIARATTPLDVANSNAITGSAALFVTAGGRHPDILGGFRRVAEREPLALAAICGSATSPLQRVAADYSFAQYHAFPLPSGKDGFLATNSLLGFTTLLLRSFKRAYNDPNSLPFFEGLDSECGTTNFLRNAKEATRSLWGRRSVLVLHGPWGASAAADFESRFHESGFASVQVSDFRNFGHGRHFWLERMREQTCVLAFACNDDADIATRTLALIPPDIERATIRINNVGPVATLGLLLSSIYAADWAGDAIGADPGRPAVPEFGRRIYHLNAWRTDRRRGSAHRLTILERKARRSQTVLRDSPALRRWSTALERFLHALESAQFGAVALDYDGTVCSPDNRFTRPGEEISGELEKLLAQGLRIGIATGRGKSVRDSLREVVSKTWWSRVTIGYYNGAQTATLAEDSAPFAGTPEGALLDFLDLLKQQNDLWPLLRIEGRRDQLTIEPVERDYTDEVLRWCQHLVHSSRLPVAALFSTRSIDVIRSSTTKQTVVTALSASAAAGSHVLCIGDAGEWPGNDFVLLSNQFSLSSASVSPDPSTCWNLAPPGVRGCDATLAYLNALEVNDGIGKLNLEKLGIWTSN